MCSRLQVVSSFPSGDRRESSVEIWESARKVGRGQKKSEGGEVKEFFLLFVSFNPFPLSLFLSSLHFSRALSSLDARFSTIFWRKRGDNSQSNVFNLVQPSSLTQKVFYPMTFVWMFGNLQGQLRKCTQFFWQNSKRLICDRYLTFLEYRNRWRHSFALWSAQNSSFLIIFFLDFE